MTQPRSERHAAMGPGAEFDAIRAMIERWGDRARDIGDDAAVLSIPRGEQVIASVDTAIEQRHFRAEWLTPREIGFRAVIAALSDLAAMAARPSGILVALAIPTQWQPAIAELADGIGEAAAVSGTRILGGNTSAADALAITTTVLGTAYTPLRRGGLRDGDAIYVTGQLGGPAAAVAAWGRGQSPAPAHRERFARPRARLHEGLWLADRGASAAIDISDGLAADLGHLAAASSIGIDIDLGQVPVVAGVSDLEAASSGEEYELAVGASSDLDVAEFAERFGIPLTRVGKASRAHGGVILTRGGARVANPPGHDHLSS